MKLLLVRFVMALVASSGLLVVANSSVAFADTCSTTWIGHGDGSRFSWTETSGSTYFWADNGIPQPSLVTVTNNSSYSTNLWIDHYTAAGADQGNVWYGTLASGDSVTVSWFPSNSFYAGVNINVEFPPSTTGTFVGSWDCTFTPTPTLTSTPTNTPTPTFTPTNTPLPTNTPTPTNTPVPTNTPTNTPIPTPAPSTQNFVTLGSPFNIWWNNPPGNDDFPSGTLLTGGTTQTITLSITNFSDPSAAGYGDQIMCDSYVIVSRSVYTFAASSWSDSGTFIVPSGGCYLHVLTTTYSPGTGYQTAIASLSSNLSANSAYSSFTISGDVCQLPNKATTEAQPICANGQNAVYMPGVTIRSVDDSQQELGSGITNSSGHYSFTSKAPFGSFITVELAQFGPPNPNGDPVNLGWFPIGESYLIQLPPVGPLQNQSLDFEYVEPEAPNSTWWVLNGGSFSNTRVPCSNITSQSCSVGGTGFGGSLAAVGMAVVVTEFGVVSKPGINSQPKPPDGVVTDKFSIDLSNSTSSASTVLVSNDQTLPVDGSSDTTTVIIPANSIITIPVVGEGGIKTTVGETIVVNTVPLQSEAIAVETQIPIPLSPPTTITATILPPQQSDNAVAQTTCGISLFSLWSGLGPLLECLFEPTLTLTDMISVTDSTGTQLRLDDAIKEKAGFAEFFTVFGYVCPDPQPCTLESGLFGNLHEGTACWNGFIPWLDITVEPPVMSNTTITFTVCASDPIPNIIRTMNTICILIFLINGLVDIGLKLFAKLSKLAANEMLA